MSIRRPNKSPEPTAVGACSSAVAVHVTSRRWLSFFRDGPGAAQHLELNASTLFIANNTVAHGPLATALVMFAEFQHDPQSGTVQDENPAQVEFAADRQAIYAINPQAQTPYIDGLQHGNGGY